MTGFTDDYLASKDDAELLEMRDNWALNGDELADVNDELEARNGGVSPRIAADDDTGPFCFCGHAEGSHVANGACLACEDGYPEHDVNPEHEYEEVSE